MRQIEQQARQVWQAEQQARLLRQAQQPQRVRRTELRQTPSRQEVRRTGRMVWAALCVASLLVLIQRLFPKASNSWGLGLLIMGGAVLFYAVLVYGVAVSLAGAESEEDEYP